MNKHAKVLLSLSAVLTVCLLLLAAGCGVLSRSDSPDTSPGGILTLPEADSDRTPAESVPAPEPQTLPAVETDAQEADGHTWVLQSLVTSDGAATVPCAGNFLCTDCGKTRVRTVTPQDVRVPIVQLSGSVSRAEAGAELLDIAYDDGVYAFSCKARISIQGASSAGMPKKNWTLRLQDEQGGKVKVKPVDGWGWHSKFCLKANYVDFSQARNVVSGRLYGETAASRGKSDDLSRAPNYGAVDGFPVAVFVNGSFHGLYTFNIPKDDWMFAMNGGPDTHQAILMGADWTDHVALRKTTSSFKHGWELEYCSTEDTGWVMSSFNKMIDFINSADGAKFRRGIGQYVDVERAIDTLLFTTLIHGSDNVSKNILWVTYDGEIWIPSVWDMDDSWGMVWNGAEYYSSSDFSFSEVAGRNVLWQKLWKNFRKEITARWHELRGDVLSVGHIKKEFKAFFDGVPDLLYEADAVRWPDCPSRRTSNYKQIADYTVKRLKYLDSLM